LSRANHKAGKILIYFPVPNSIGIIFEFLFQVVIIIILKETILKKFTAKLLRYLVM